MAGDWEDIGSVGDGWETIGTDSTSTWEEPVPEKGIIESAHPADVVKALDMILSIPGFAEKVGERGMTTLIAALHGDATPIATANKISDEVTATGWRKFSLAPIATILESAGVKIPTDTAVDKIMGKIGEGVEYGAGKVEGATGSSEAGAAFKQLVDVGMLGMGSAAARMKPKTKLGDVTQDLLKKDEVPPTVEPTVPKIEREIPYTPPELSIAPDRPVSPETRPQTTAEIPRYENGVDFDYGGLGFAEGKLPESTPTPKAPFSIESPVEAAVRVNTPEQVGGTYTPKQDFSLGEGGGRSRPIYESGEVAPLDFELGVQSKLPLDPRVTAETIPYRGYATPEQGAWFQERIPTDVTQPKAEVPVQSEMFKTQRDWTPTEEISLGKAPEEGAGVTRNASGESAASAEAINRFQSEQAQGITRYKYDVNSGKLTPLITADRVDVFPGKNEATVTVGPKGEVTILDNNSKYGVTPLKNRIKADLAKQEKSPLGGVGAKQGGAVDLSVFKEGFDKLREKVGKGANIASEGADYAFGGLDTRLGNISPLLKQANIKFEGDLVKNAGDRIQNVDPFFTQVNKNLKKADREIVDNLLLDNKYHTLEGILPKEMKGGIQKIRDTLNEVGRELQKYGIIENFRENYFPRMIKDYDGLLKAMGREPAVELLKLFAEKETKKGGALTDIEKAEITNKFLRNQYRQGGKPGFTKERKFDEVPDELKKFYFSPTQTIHTYLRSATYQIERAKFFGKHAVKDEAGRLDLEGSIGNLYIDLLNKGQLDPAKTAELADLLRTRFGRGQAGSNAGVRGAMDVVHAALLSDVGNAIMQGADVALLPFTEGVRPTLAGLVKSLNPNKRLNLKEFGLLDHMSEEFVSDNFTTKMANKALIPMAKMDRAAKTVILNTVFKRAILDARSYAKGSPLFTEYKARFGDRFPQLLDDLQQGKRTALTDELVLSELAARQPIFKSAYSQMYLDSPNIARPAMVLTSFMLRTADFIRNRAYNQIKEGNVKTGVNNLIRLSAGLAVGQVSMNAIRNFIANKPIDEVDTKHLVAAMLGIFRFNDQFSENIQKGAVGEAIAGSVAPPWTALDPLAKDITALAFGDERKDKFTGKSIKYIPYVGDELYGWSEYGEENRRKLERQARQKSIKESRE